MNENKRQTGRTTRMLEHAIQLAKCGRAVYVLAADDRQVANLRGALDDLLPDGCVGRMGIKIETIPPTFDPERVRLAGAHPNCIVLLDHHAIETVYGRLLAMATAFDAGGTICPAMGGRG